MANQHQPPRPPAQAAQHQHPAQPLTAHTAVATPPHPRADEPKEALPAAIPDPSMMTIADEQRARSEEIEKVGSDAWVKAHDQRTDEEKGQKAVPGVAHRQVEAHEAASHSAKR